MFNDFHMEQQNFRDLNRHEKSLGLLTEKFVQLLKEAPDGILDLKMVGYYGFFKFVGSRFFGRSSKKKNLRHYKCFGGYWFD